VSGVPLNEAGVERIERRRPWIFAGQIRRRPEGTPGELVPATDSRGRVRGWGFLSPSALSLRLISYEPRRPDLGALLRERLASALAWGVGRIEGRKRPSGSATARPTASRA